MEQVVQPFYLHLNMMGESNSNNPTYSGTRQGKKKKKEEAYVYAGQHLLSVTTIIQIPNQLILLSHTVPQC